MAIGFNKSGVERIVRAVKKSEHTPTDLSGTPNKAGPAVEAFWAELVEESGGDVGHYSWKKLSLVDGEFVDWQPEVASVGHSAYEFNEHTGLPAGEKVWMKFVGYDASGLARYVFQHDIYPQPIYQGTAVVGVADNQFGIDFIRNTGLIENPAS